MLLDNNKTIGGKNTQQLNEKSCGYSRNGNIDCYLNDILNNLFIEHIYTGERYAR